MKIANPLLRRALIPAAAVLSLLAVGMAYVGILIGISLVGANDDLLAFSVLGIYLLVAVIGPFGLGVWLTTHKKLTISVRFVVCTLIALVGNAIFLPVAMASLRM